MTGMLEGDWSAILSRRLERHSLSGPAHDLPLAELARAMCGVHAQVMTAAEQSIAMRTGSATRADVRRALWEDHTLVKTYGPRGTVHILPMEDLPMWTGALSAIPGGPTMPSDLRMTPDQTAQVVTAIADALHDAELTIDELSDAVVARTGSWAGDLVMPAFGGMWPRWRQAMGTAAHQGAFVFGPQRGRKVTYTNPRRWSSGMAPEESEKAGAWLLRHYLHAYGPATPGHYAKWLSAPVGWASRLFSSLRDELEPVTLNGETAWLNAGDAIVPGAMPKGFRLLPYFDAYVVGSQPRELLFPGAAATRALARGQAGNFPVMVIDGVVAGVWHLARSGKRISVTVEPLVDLSPAMREEIDAQVERIGAIHEGVASWEEGVVTVGPHA